MLADADRSSRFLEELIGAASHAAEPERPVRREKRKRATPGVTVALGDAVALQGGIRGIVTEFDSDGLWVGVDGGGQFRARWGDDVTTDERTGPLTPSADTVSPDADLVERLKAWRLETARTKKVPAYVILHDATIETIAGIRPQTETQLASIPGIGPAKLEAYGDAILELCAE